MINIKKEIYRKLNVINEKLCWVGDYAERDAMLSQKRGLVIQLEEINRIEKEDADELCRQYIQKSTK